MKEKKTTTNHTCFMNRLISWLLVITLLFSAPIPTQVFSVPTPVAAATKKTPKLSKTSAVIKIGQKSRIYLYNAVSNQVAWASENKQIVAVSKSGYITGVNNGTVKIYATYKNQKYTCRITVPKVSISNTSVSIYAGKKVSLKLNNAYGTTSWKSSDRSIATVSSSGQITGKKTGKTTITATNQGITYTCTLNVLDLNKKTNNAIDTLIVTARKEIGYREKRTERNLDSKTANAGYNNYTKYARDVDDYYQGDPWCAMFISWCMMKTYGRNTAKKLLKDWPYVACRYLPYYLPSYNTPKKGDIVLFYNGSDYEHTGLVTKVQGARFWTIEGNTKKITEVIPEGYCVCEKSYYIKTLPKVKFCRPQYQIAV